MFSRRIASLTAKAPKRGAGTSEKPPLNLPIGVRAAPAKTTLVPGFTTREERGRVISLWCPGRNRRSVTMLHAPHDRPVTRRTFRHERLRVLSRFGEMI